MTTSAHKLSSRLFDINFEGLVKCNHRGGILDANAVFLEMLGYGSVAEMSGARGHPVPRHWQDIEQEIIRDQVQAHGFSQKYNKEYYHKDGSLIHVEQVLWLTPDAPDDPVVWGLVKDLSKERYMREKVKALLYRLENTDRHRNELIEEASRLIAAEIHDSVGQQLTGITLELDSLKSRVNDDGRIQAHIDKILGLADESLQQVRNICTDLRPADQGTPNGIAAIREYCTTWQARTGITTEVSSNLEYFGEPLNSAAYRIVQEALTNVSRHAQATEVHVGIRQSRKHVTLSIQDNGKGIPSGASETLHRWACSG